MKKRILSILLCLCMAAALMPSTALAWTQPYNIEVNNATYYSNGALKEITADFDWHTASASSRLVLMTERLRSAGEDGTNTTWGDFTDLGFYGSKFSSFEEVCDYDENGNNAGAFGIISYTDESSVTSGTNTMTMSFDELMIPLNTNKIYYIYLWTQYYGYNYPDTLICAIGVQDGAVRYAAATDRNSYDESSFGNVESQKVYDVTVTPAEHMTRDNSSGENTQTDLSAAMTPIIYTADEGYYFPDAYSVDTVNGIMVRRDSQSQITVYGTPSSNAAIALTAPTQITTYTVSFDKNGNSSATDTAPQTVADGEKVAEPAAPTAEGYTFGGWYKEPECTNPWIFDTDTVNGTIILYAKWVANLPTSLEDTVFGYAYDVQRSPAFPTKNQEITLSGLDYPILDTGSRGTTNSGSWMLTKAGTYSYMKSIGKNTSELDDIITSIVSNYSNSLNREAVVIHELKDGAAHIAYGVVVAYDAANGYAVFLGDTLSGGAGYLLSTRARSDSVTATAGTIATDFVQNLSISLSETGTYTFEEATEGYGEQTPKEITVTNTGNDATGDLNVTLSGANATGFTLSKTTINSITDTDSTDTFTVKPNTGLDVGTYTATVTVTGMNIVSRSFDVSFTVSSAATYTVKFNANGGSGTMADMTVNVGAHPALAENTFTRAGYEFIGWNDQPDGSGTNYADKDSAPTANAGESITLYAKWVHGKVSDDAAHVSGIEADGLNEVAKEEKTDITLIVQDEAAAEDDTEQAAIKASADAPKKFGFYDIRLEKSTGGTVENASSVIEIKLPYDFTKKTNIKVYRYHGAAAEELTQLDTRAMLPYEDGKCFVNKENGCIYIYSSKFSTYAVAYDTVSANAGGRSNTTRYTVKFDTDGGSAVSSKTVTRNSKAAEPADPTKDGYTFDGWYSDKNFTAVYDFNQPVTKNLTLYAKWTEVKTEEPDVEQKMPDTECDGTSTDNCSSLAFDDLNVKLWYHSDTDYVIENGLMEGTTSKTFEPNADLTRAMLVTVLYRLEGEPATNKSIPFTDIDMGAYYKNAVIWAQQNDIVKGISETEFAPNENITREQITAIIYRYAQYKEYDVSVGASTNILSYNDFADISEYAVPSVQYAMGSGLLEGRTETELNPKDNATRAEAAAILHRFIEANK